jgi:hypothetical protein
LLLWHPGSERIEVTVRDVETGFGFRLEIAPEAAIGAFQHAFAYVARRENSNHE